MNKTVTLSLTHWAIIHNVLSHHAPERWEYADETVYDEYVEARNSIRTQLWG